MISKMNLPWLEKYRPHTIDDLVLDNQTQNKIKTMISNKEIPNLIITGTPGIGKTSAVLCIAKNLLKEKYNDAILEMNASDDRGIKFVQDTISNFCKKKISNKEDKEQPHKIVLLDEADNMTHKAQQLISGLMENYEKTTRFALTCNNSFDIIESIQSRCNILRFNKLSKEKIKGRLMHICKLEKVKYDDNGLNYIIKLAEGDLRSAINILQLVHISYDKVTEENLNKINDKPQTNIITNILQLCQNKQLLKAIKEMQKLSSDGYAPADIIIGMTSVIKDLKTIDPNEKEEVKGFVLTELEKIKYLSTIFKTEIIINKGTSTELQLHACLSNLCLI